MLVAAATATLRAANLVGRGLNPKVLKVVRLLPLTAVLKIQRKKTMNKLISNPGQQSDLDKIIKHCTVLKIIMVRK